MASSCLQQRDISVFRGRPRAGTFDRRTLRGFRSERRRHWDRFAPARSTVRAALVVKGSSGSIRSQNCCSDVTWGLASASVSAPKILTPPSRKAREAVPTAEPGAVSSQIGSRNPARNRGRHLVGLNRCEQTVLLSRDEENSRQSSRCSGAAPAPYAVPGARPRPRSMRPR